MLMILIMISLTVTSVFMILLILVQRGRGGGLAGAFGGMGGQSAFGTKAGDMFTKITIWTAFFWIVLCAVTVRQLSQSPGGPLDEAGPAGANIPAAKQDAAGETPSGVGAGSTVPGDPKPAEEPDN